MAMENPHFESEIHLRMMVDFSIAMLFLQGGNDTMSGSRRLCSKSFATTKKETTLHGVLGIQKLVPKQIQVYIKLKFNRYYHIIWVMLQHGKNAVDSVKLNRELLAFRHAILQDYCNFTAGDSDSADFPHPKKKKTSNNRQKFRLRKPPKKNKKPRAR